MADIANSAKIGAKISLHAAYALTIGLHLRVNFLYPAVHGNSDILNKYLKASMIRNSWSKMSLKEVNLLWTDDKFGQFDDNTAWTANHLSIVASKSAYSQEVEASDAQHLPKFKNYHVSSADMNGVFQVMLDPTTKIWRDIPRGKKSNVQFKVQNPNVARWDAKLASAQNGKKQKSSFRNPTCKF